MPCGKLDPCRASNGPAPRAVAISAGINSGRPKIGPIIGLPLLIPALIATARGAGPLLQAHGASFPQGKWLAILALYDLVFALLSYAVFDFLLED